MGKRRRRWVVEEPSVSLAHVLGPGAKAASWEQDQIHSPVEEQFWLIMCAHNT